MDFWKRTGMGKYKKKYFWLRFAEHIKISTCPDGLVGRAPRLQFVQKRDIFAFFSKILIFLVFNFFDIANMS